MPGPGRKPQSTVQRRNTPAIVTDLPPSLRLAAPPVTVHWLKVTREAWASFWESPVADLVDRNSDMPALRRLYDLQDDAARFRASIRKNPMVMGSRDQMVRNPFVKDLESVQAEIRQLEDRFGLSPKARLQLGVMLGGAQKSLADLAGDLADDGQDDTADEPDWRTGAIDA